MPQPPHNNIYNRNQNFFQPQAPQFARALPAYPQTMTHSPITMMNYFNNPSGPSIHQPPSMEHTHGHHQHQHIQPQKQQIPIDVVSLEFNLFRTYRYWLSNFQDLSQQRLSKLGCEDFISLLNQVNELKGAIEKLSPILRENAITGRVLLYCELSELKSVLQLNFGNWEIFKLLILSLRDIENNAKSIPSVKTDNRDINEGASGSQTQQPLPRIKQKSVIEKQVCKALWHFHVNTKSETFHSY